MSGLKGITINTDPAAEAHVYAEDDAAIYQSIFGSDGVLTIGQQCESQVISNNKVRVKDGVIVVGGHIARIPYGDYCDCEIANGQSGKNRNDIIIAKFVSTGTGGIDTMTCEVKQGSATTDTATDPVLTQEDLYESGKIREMPLYRVKIEGLSIVGVEPMFDIVPTIPTLNAYLSQLSSKIPEEDNGYLKFVDGTLIQWGSDTTSNTNAVKVINLQIPFINNSYFVTYQFTRNANTVTRSWIGDAGGNEARTEDNFGIYLQRSSGTSTVAISWAAIGRWK